MRKTRRLAALVAAALLLTSPAAVAGGPTSVLVVSPSSERATALTTSQYEYTELGQALGENPTETDKSAPDLHDSPGASAVNITWLMHDVQVWRVDHVFLTEPGGPWVETYQSLDGNIKFDQRGVVHKAADPVGLRKLLYSLLETAPAPVPVSAPISEPAPAQPAGLHWGSLLVGLLIGAVVMIVVRQLRGKSVST